MILCTLHAPLRSMTLGSPYDPFTFRNSQLALRPFYVP